MSKNKSLEKKHSSQKTGFSSSLKGYVLEKKWFFLLLAICIFSLVIIIIGLTQPNMSEEKANVARATYESNVEKLDYLINQLEQTTQNDRKDTLYDDYYSSTKSDLVWLKAKGEMVYHSQPNSLILARETAFDYFVIKILNTNNQSVDDFDSNTQAYTVNRAMTMNMNYPKLLTDEDLIFLFEDSVAEQNAFREEVVKLFDDYIQSKKTIISSTDSLERKFVEAKKIIWIAMEAEYS